MSAIYGRPYGIIDTFFRCAYNFNNPIGMAMLYRVAELQANWVGSWTVVAMAGQRSRRSRIACDLR